MIAADPTSGYLIAERSDTDSLYAPHSYRGIDRLPPVSAEMYNEGFHNPLVYEEITDDIGLIKTRDLAAHAIEEFVRQNYPRPLEVIFVVRSPAENAEHDTRCRFLGYDLADDYSPFWSHVLNMPLEIEKHFTSLLNEKGLFDNAADAERLWETVEKEYGTDEFPYWNPKAVWAVYACD